MLPIAALLVLFVAPLAYALVGWMRSRRMPAPRAPLPRWNWRITLASLLLYVLAFNLVFFVQEVFLVLPKAFVPGVDPTLFHNNHSWTGEHPLTELFQGTGALATLLLGIACAWRLRRNAAAPAWRRMLLFWLAFGGVFMALPQVVAGVLIPQGDVGRAMAYLALAPAAKTALALLSLAAMPLFALWLLRPLLALADAPAQVATARGRHRFVFLAATLPGLLAIAPIVAYRVPREWIEVLIVPVVVTIVGLAWIQAGAWRVADVEVRGTSAHWPTAALFVAAIALLAVFQLVLRPGITF